MLVAMVVVGAGILAWRVAPEPGFDREGWRGDYHELRRQTSLAYANLEYTLDNGLLDPVALDSATEARLATARSSREARRAIADFAEAFGDGHFRVVREPPAFVTALEGWWHDTRSREITSALDAETACRRLGFSDRVLASSLSGEARYAAVRVEGPFPTGLLTAGTADSSPTIGVIRIAHFGEDGYLATCIAEWEAMRPTLPEGACDEACSDPIWTRVANRLLATLAERVRELAARGATTLVVDLTGNGGGTDWVEAAARTLTPVPLRASSWSLVRHPHHARSMQRQREALQGDLDSFPMSDEVRAIVTRRIARLDSLIPLAQAGCDRSVVWARRDTAPPCRLVTALPPAPAYLPPGALGALPSRGHLWTPSWYAYEEGAWRGELLVLVDGGTASASELFTALLADNGAARVVGERTYGAGCGYTWGGLGIVLPHSGLAVKMPDCVRLRADGTNERAGIPGEAWEP